MCHFSFFLHFWAGKLSQVWNQPSLSSLFLKNWIKHFLGWIFTNTKLVFVVQALPIKLNTTAAYHKATLIKLKSIPSTEIKCYRLIFVILRESIYLIPHHWGMLASFCFQNFFDKSVFSVQFEMIFLIRVQNLPIFGPHRNWKLKNPACMLLNAKSCETSTWRDNLAKAKQNSLKLVARVELHILWIITPSALQPVQDHFMKTALQQTSYLLDQ